MTAEVVSIGPREQLEDVVRLMEKHHVKRLPVIDEGRLVGIVSRADLVRALADKLAQAAATDAEVPTSDGEIRRRIAAIIDKEPWGPRFGVDIAVADGVVHLHGTVTDERERSALRVAAETVPGVKAIRDHLIWIEPTSGIAIPSSATGVKQP
jgi:CBS domain-containing protein